MKNSRKIMELKEKKYIQQDGQCAACGKVFMFGEAQELSHILPQRLWIIKKYGEQYIHHDLNMKLTHSGDCNSAVQMSPNKTELVEAHIEAIRKEIEESKC